MTTTKTKSFNASPEKIEELIGVPLIGIPVGRCVESKTDVVFDEENDPDKITVKAVACRHTPNKINVRVEMTDGDEGTSVMEHIISSRPIRKTDKEQ